MILLVHMLLGAAIGSAVKNIPLAIALAFLSHYFLDLFPHIEYDIENITKKQWRKALPNFLRVFLDFCLGALLIFLFSKNYSSIYVCAFIAVLPDGLYFLGKILPIKIFETHNRFCEEIQIFNKAKIPIFWRFASQIIAVIVSILLLV